MKSDEMRQMFQRDKRYMYVVGLLVIFTSVLDFDLTELDIFGLKADINNPDNFTKVLGLFFVWFAYRTYMLSKSEYEWNDLKSNFGTRCIHSGWYMAWMEDEKKSHINKLVKLGMDRENLTVAYVTLKDESSFPYHNKIRGFFTYYIIHELSYGSFLPKFTDYPPEVGEYVKGVVMHPNLYVRMKCYVQGVFYYFNEYINLFGQNLIVTCISKDNN
jgi:hypothetical protein